jgi:hypothetical protein
MTVGPSMARGWGGGGFAAAPPSPCAFSFRESFPSGRRSPGGGPGRLPAGPSPPARGPGPGGCPAPAAEWRPPAPDGRGPPPPVPPAEGHTPDGSGPRRRPAPPLQRPPPAAGPPLPPPTSPRADVAWPPGSARRSAGSGRISPTERRTSGCQTQRSVRPRNPRSGRSGRPPVRLGPGAVPAAGRRSSRHTRSAGWRRRRIQIQCCWRGWVSSGQNVTHGLSTPW